MNKKKVEIIHKEQNEECFEVLKSTIIEDKELKKFRIDKDTMLKELPIEIVNEFLDFIGSNEQHRNLILHMIKSGSLIIECWEDEDDTKKMFHHTQNYKDQLMKRKQNAPISYQSGFNVPF